MRLARFSFLAMLWFAAAASCLHAADATTLDKKALSQTFERSGKSWEIAADKSLVSLAVNAPRGQSWDMRHARNLSIKAERTATGSAPAQLRWVVHSRIGGMYLGPAALLPLSASGTIAVNFSPSAGELSPLGHQRPWDTLAAGEVTALELRAECTQQVLSTGRPLQINLSSVTLETGKPGSSASQILDLKRFEPPAGSRARAVISFRIDPMPEDPYAPEGAGDVRIKLPSGKQALAFLDQDFLEINDGAAVRLEPIGLPVWRAYLPDWGNSGALEIVSGTNSWKVPCSALDFQNGPATPSEATTRGQSTPSIPAEIPRQPKALAKLRWDTPLEASAPSSDSDWTGTGALWKLAPSGDWLPIDHSALAGFFPKVATNTRGAGGQSNVIWRPVPFWNPGWGGYAGAKRPDSALARRMDALLESAADDGSSRPLAILDGNALERQGVFNWASHPLRGAMSGPGEMFRTEAGFDFCARWLRYCIARYSHSKAVSTLWITTDLNAPGASDFHARIAYMLRSWLAGNDLPTIAFHPLARPARTVKEIGTFESERGVMEAWHVDGRLTRAYGRNLDHVGLGGGHCFELNANDPTVTDLAFQREYKLEAYDYRKPADDNFFACDALMFEVWTPGDAPHDLRVGVHLRDKEGQWFQTLLPGMIRTGDWTTYALDLTAANGHNLTGVNHRRAWTAYSRQRIQEIGLHVYSTHPRWAGSNGRPQNLSVRFDNIRGVVYPQSYSAPQTQIALFDPYSQPAIQASNISAEPMNSGKKTYERGSLVEFHLKLNETFANPFDARDCDLMAIVKTPSGKVSKVPAFFNQLCQRHEDRPGGNEVVDSIGEEFFTVRYRAQEVGPHAVTIELRRSGKYDVQRTWAADDRFTPDGEGQVAQGRSWPYTNYPNRFPGEGKRPVDKVTFLPGKVTATLDLGPSAFTVVESAKPFHGFVRVANDKRHFEFDDGSFFFPIGPCLRSPSDTRVPYNSPKFNRAEIDRLGGRGTYQFDEYFAAFEKAGVNWGRMWMCSWWGALEWRRDWPGYQGFSRYNLLNAWRVDYVLDQAEKKNIYLNLALTNHGQYTLAIDTEWRNNPYNAALGGPLTAASEIFTRAEGKIAHQNKLRYVAARYGHSPAVMAFALFSEIEFTEEYERCIAISRGGRRHDPDLPSPNVESWHREMASFLKGIDPNRHLVATHFSHPMRGEGTMMVPEVDIATSNAYSMFEEWGDHQGDASSALHDFWLGNAEGTVKGFHIYNKPALVEEQGRHWMGMDGGRETNTLPQLDADLHAGLWGSMATPLSGATGYWWWLHVHYDNRYSHYTALVNFMKGEDFRPIGNEKPLEPVFRQLPKSVLLGRAMRSDKRMYAWIYHPSTPLGEEVEDVPNGTMKVGGLQPGKYKVEFWDTYKGVPTGSLEIEFKKDAPNIEIKLPVVKRDLAMKVKPVEK